MDLLDYEVDDSSELQNCTKATIHDVPTPLLSEIFDHLDAYSRVRLRRVCSGWDDQLTCHRQTTSGIFLDIDQLYLKTNISSRLDTFINSKSLTYNYEFERVERGLDRLAYDITSKIIPPEATTLYGRIQEPLRKFQKLVMRKSFYRQCFSILLKSFLRGLFGETSARRIVFCDSLLMEDIVTISIATPDKGYEDEMVMSFNRLYWARSSMKDLTLWNCGVMVRPLTPEGRTEIVLANFSFHLDEQHKPLDMICAFRNDCCPKPDVPACVQHIQYMLSLREGVLPLDAVENPEIASRTSWLKQYVSKIPEDIGKNWTANMEFYKLMNSSMFLLHMWLYR